MRRSHLARTLLLLAAPAIASFAAVAPAPAPTALACTLLGADDLRALQKTELVESKGSEEDRAGLAVSQCFLHAADFARSVSVVVTLQQANRPPAHGGVRAIAPRERWDSLFHEHEEAGEEGEEIAKPEPVKGLGDEAFWLPSAAGGALYVLQGEAYLRISAGGPGDAVAKQAQARALAERALPRLAAAMKHRG